MKLCIHHHTEYLYQEPVTFTPHSLFLRPRERSFTRLVQFHLQIEPAARVTWTIDCNENPVAEVYFEYKPARKMGVTADMVMEVAETNPFDFLLHGYASELPFSYKPEEQRALLPCLGDPSLPSDPALRAWIRDSIPEQTGPTVPLLSALNSAVHNSFHYTRRDEPGIQTVADTLREGSGTCRDFALFFMEACRSLGIAARYASGYLYDPPEPETSTTPNVAAGSMHAWVELYLPGAGWKGFDPTNGILVTERFLTVAVAHSPEMVSPVQGTYASDKTVPSTLHTDLTIERRDDGSGKD